MSWPAVAFALGFMLACGSPAAESDVEPRAEAEGSESERVQAEAVTEQPPAEQPSAEQSVEQAASEDESEPEDEPEGEPTVSTSISFDLRGMPHRGPRDVDPVSITSRVQYLMQQTRDAAGEPAPRLLYNPGISVFRAQFFGSEAEALAQCNRAVAEVAPEIEPGSRSRRAVFRAPQSTPCAPIEAAAE